MTPEQSSPGAWERFVKGLSPLEPVPRVILDSWRRSSAAGVDPLTPNFRHVGAEELRRRLARSGDLVGAARTHIEAFSRGLDISHVMYLVDADGIVLLASASSEELADECRLHPGFDWSERVMGTNGAGTALATGAPAAIIGCDHYCAAWHRSACLAAPIRAGSRILGAIDLTTTVRDAGPFELAQVVRMATLIERRLAGVVDVQGAGAQADVLVFDEDLESREATASLLRRSGLTVLASGEAGDTLAQAAGSRPRIVLLDLRLPGLYGIEICWRLKADPATADIPVVALADDARSIHHARAAGCEGFLVKPVQANELLSTVLERCRPLRTTPA